MSPAFATEVKLTFMYHLKRKIGPSKGSFPHKLTVAKPFQALHRGVLATRITLLIVSALPSSTLSSIVNASITPLWFNNYIHLTTVSYN